MNQLPLYRRFFAEEIRAVADLTNEALVQALATVPREEFLGPGPWSVVRLKQGMGPPEYRPTPDANPEHIYHNIPVAIDPVRKLNNGQPQAIAPSIESLDLTGGERVLHVGAGTGYYSAILAEVVGPQGHVVAIEVDPHLAERARANLASRAWVEVFHGDGSKLTGLFDAIFINAGATHPRSEWLDALAPGGRLVLPLTASLGLPLPISVGDRSAGFVVKVHNGREGYSVRFLSPVAIFDCEGARDETLNTKLGQLFRQGGWKRINSLRRDPHPESSGCVLHADHFCLSEDKVQ